MKKNKIEDEVNERTIIVGIDDEALAFELEQPDEWDEDTFYAYVYKYVLSNLQIEIQ